LPLCLSDIFFLYSPLHFTHWQVRSAKERIQTDLVQTWVLVFGCALFEAFSCLKPNDVSYERFVVLLLDSEASAMSASSPDGEATRHTDAAAHARKILQNGTKEDKQIAKTLTKTLEKWSKKKAREKVLARLENLDSSSQSRAHLRQFLASLEFHLGGRKRLVAFWNLAYSEVGELPSAPQCVSFVGHDGPIPNPLKHV
jgi:hypothetical protein